MAKKKESTRANDAQQRISFLHQAAMIVSSECPGMAAHLNQNAAAISQRAVVRVTPEMKRTRCRHCHAPLTDAPGSALRVRTSSRRQPHVIRKCLTCGEFSRIPIAGTPASSSAPVAVMPTPTAPSNVPVAVMLHPQHPLTLPRKISMGVKGLMKLVADNAPKSVEESEMKHLFGRKVALDASMAMYAVMVAVRPETTQIFTSAAGDPTGHLLGIWMRTLRMVKHGLQPAWVFDGKPPDMKADELKRRGELKKKADEAQAEARETGDVETEGKMSKRNIRITKEQFAEVKRMLRLMGMPVVDAPCEAEAQCAELCRAGMVYGVGTEDMDTLAFGAPHLLKNLTTSEAQKRPVRDIRLDRLLDGLALSMPEFVDLCILCGCDYCPAIRGIGPKRALDLIVKHRTLEAVLENIDSKKYPVPEHYPFKEARRLFFSPEVSNPESIELTWSDPDEDGLVQFLVHEKQFDESRIRKDCVRLRDARKLKPQGRLDGFLSKPISNITSPLSLASSSKIDKKKESEKESNKKESNKKESDKKESDKKKKEEESEKESNKKESNKKESNKKESNKKESDKKESDKKESDKKKKEEDVKSIMSPLEKAAAAATKKSSPTTSTGKIDLFAKWGISSQSPISSHNDSPTKRTQDTPTTPPPPKKPKRIVLDDEELE